ncbi:conserved hypothetical protein [Methylobacterium nodulans ORS 2060]|uniref:Uncharacterized protein n=1 Tax=Methylobacterium nodulans (strain LMG 21967 / CNCM I-2342 / ORS 2060) TaxID=460265 RepID=B8IHW7_METNO|nr:conserved hypothetical protein [Methylobacterium nodulans ORS 2060]
MNAWVPKELAARLSELPRRPCPLSEAGHEPHRPVFAEILDRTGHGTGHFVRLPQSMVEMITREARSAAEPAAPQPAPPAAPEPEPEPAGAGKPKRRRARKAA